MQRAERLSRAGFGPQRVATHIGLALVTALGCWWAVAAQPELDLVHSLTIGTAYVSLAQLAATLLIGPWQLLRRQQRNPANINLRRDIGIWAGLVGVAHVVFGFQVHMGGNILHYFFRPDSWLPQINVFGAANYLGLAATLVLLALLLLSNDLSLRTLKGRRWKAIQRFNYVLFAAVLLHTWGYQFEVQRVWIMPAVSIALTAAVLAAQAIGYRYYRMRWDKGGQK
jgi:sulfoxide reductase heme-binding subunit YedZ